MFHIRDYLHQGDGAREQLPERPDQLRMARMANDQDMTALAMVELSLPMHLRDERTSGIDGKDITLPGILENRFWHTMRGKNNRLPRIRYFVQFLDEHRAFGLQLLDDKFIMHDFVADIDRRAINAERFLHRFDGAHHARAEAARRAKVNMKLRLIGHAKRARNSSPLGVRSFACQVLEQGIVTATLSLSAFASQHA